MQIKTEARTFIPVHVVFEDQSELDEIWQVLNQGVWKCEKLGLAPFPALAELKAGLDRFVSHDTVKEACK